MSYAGELALSIREFVVARRHSPTLYSEDGEDLILESASGIFRPWVEVYYKGKLVFDFTNGVLRKYVPGDWEARVKELSRHTIVKKLLG